MRGCICQVRLLVIGIFVLGMIRVPVLIFYHENISMFRSPVLSQTFPIENYNFTVSLEPGEWDYVLSFGIYGDALYGVFDVVPYGEPIDFFICDYDNLLEWVAGNMSIERYTVYEKRDFAYWTFIPPYDAFWYYVFINKGDSDIVVWMMEYFDTNPPFVLCNLNEYNEYELPIDLVIEFEDFPYNISYYSVYLYDDLLAEEKWTPQESSYSQSYSETFTIENLEGLSNKLNFTGYTNDTVGNGKFYSYNISIVEPAPSPTSSTSTSARTTNPTNRSSGPPIIVPIFLASIVGVCCGILGLVQRVVRRKR